MGHRFESLSLPAHLVAWHEAGLELIRSDLLPVRPDTSGSTSAFCPTVAANSAEISYAQLAPAQKELQVEPGQSSPHGPDASASAQVNPVRQAAQGSHLPLAKIRSSGRASDVSTPSPSIAGNFSGTVLTASEPEACAWSGPFLYALERLKPPVRALWTYWELAQDFGGQPDNNRRQLWVNIIKNLPFKQRVGFWPLSESQDGTMLARPALFWKGVREFGVTHVLCFGRRACMTLFPDRPFSPGVFQYMSLTAVILPGPEDMLPDNRQVKAVTWNLLKDLSV